MLFFSYFFGGFCCLGFFNSIHGVFIFSSFHSAVITTGQASYLMDYMTSFVPIIFSKFKHCFSQGLRVLSGLITMAFFFPVKPSKIQDGFVSSKSVTNFS